MPHWCWEDIIAGKRYIVTRFWLPLRPQARAAPCVARPHFVPARPACLDACLASDRRKRQRISFCTLGHESSAACLICSCSRCGMIMWICTFGSSIAGRILFCASVERSCSRLYVGQPPAGRKNFPGPYRNNHVHGHRAMVDHRRQGQEALGDATETEATEANPYPGPPR
jgi:hypothetical protein